jgi:hypothetical protein
MLEIFYSTSAAYHVTLLRTFLQTCHGCFKSNFLICHIGRDKGLVLKKDTAIFMSMLFTSLDKRLLKAKNAYSGDTVDGRR